MKIRNGFVSNSSSSSFVIPKDELTSEQIMKIHDYSEEARKHQEYYDFGDAYDMDWNIHESDFYISGYCIMDNFDMYTFLEEYLKIPREIIKWSD
jgi:hypothetical protein